MKRLIFILLAIVPCYAQLHTAAPAFVTLTDASTITLTCSSDRTIHNATVTLGGNRTLAIVGAISGSRGTLIVKQDVMGLRTLALPAGSKAVAGGVGAIVLTITASASDVLTWFYDGTNYYWDRSLNFN